MNKQEWLEARRKGIGGSDMPVIMGVSPWKSEYDLYLDKIGEAPEIEVTKPMQRGTHLEPIVAEIYSQETGRDLEVVSEIIRHKDVPYLLGNIDRKILSKENGGLEIKCPGLHVFGQCKREGLPDYYTIQLQHYLGVTGWNWGSFAIFSAERWDLIYFDMERDDELIEMMFDRAGKFWKKVENRTPPDILPEVVDLPSMPKVTGEVTKIDSPAWNKCVEDLIIARNLKAEVEAIEKQAKENIQGIMGEIGADVAESNGVRIYWKEQAGRKSFDKKALAKAHPEIDLSKFEKQGSPLKTFRFYELKPQIEYIGG